MQRIKNERIMRLSYRNYPILKIMDRRYCKSVEFTSKSEFTDKEIANYFQSIINKGCLCNRPIYYLSEEFLKCYLNNEEKLHNLLKQNEQLAHECLEDCTIIIKGRCILSNKVTKDRFAFFYFDGKGTLCNFRYGTWTQGRYLFTREEDINRMHSSMVGFITLMAFKKFASVELCTVEAHSKKKTDLDHQVKVVNDTGIDVTILDSRWFREIIRNEGFKVRGHFRLQPCKDESGNWTRKLIYINEFEKHGYHRRAQISLDKETIEQAN